MTKLLRKTRSHGTHGAFLKKCVSGETRIKAVVIQGGKKREIVGTYVEHNADEVLWRDDKRDDDPWSGQTWAFSQKTVQSIEVVE